MRKTIASVEADAKAALAELESLHSKEKQEIANHLWDWVSSVDSVLSQESMEIHHKVNTVRKMIRDLKATLS